MSRKQIFGIIETRMSLNRIYILLLSVYFMSIVIELSVDMKVTDPYILSASFLSNLSIYALWRFQKLGMQLTKFLLIFTLFCTIQSMVLVDLTNYHVMVYWSVLIPLLSLIFLNRRGSFIILGLVVMSNVLNAYIGVSRNGLEYNLDLKYINFMLASFLFISSVYIIAYIFYYLLQECYRDLAMKNDKITALNAKLANFVDTLQSDLVKHKVDVEQKSSKLDKIAFHNSHRVRSPLVKIMGAANLFGGECDDELIRIIQENALQLDQVIHDVATLSVEK